MPIIVYEIGLKIFFSVFKKNLNCRQNCTMHKFISSRYEAHFVHIFFNIWHHILFLGSLHDADL